VQGRGGSGMRSPLDALWGCLYCLHSRDGCVSNRRVQSDSAVAADALDTRPTEGGLMRQPVIKFLELARHITGISVPVFGVSWNPPASEREVVRQVFVFLEDRRALYHHHWVEVEHEVVDSVQLARTEITRALQQLPEGSKAVPFLRAMRSAIREYLDSTGPRGASSRPFPYVEELGRLRAIIGMNIAYLAVQYGIDIQGELGRLVPPDPQDDDGAPND
jgi:hypothetical protein